MKTADPWTENLRRLGLPVEATWEEVQSRYRQLVLSLHPDVNPTREAAERFRQIAAAYESLSAIWKERKARSEDELARMAEDPRISSLPPEELAMRLRYSSSARLRADAAWLLGKLEGQGTRRALLAAIGDPEEMVRTAALDSLGLVGLPGDLPRLLPLACAWRTDAVARAGRRCVARIVQRFWRNLPLFRRKQR